jgi:hypothetical protein
MNKAKFSYATVACCTEAAMLSFIPFHGANMRYRVSFLTQNLREINTEISKSVRIIVRNKT